MMSLMIRAATTGTAASAAAPLALLRSSVTAVLRLSSFRRSPLSLHLQSRAITCSSSHLSSSRRARRVSASTCKPTPPRVQPTAEFAAVSALPSAEPRRPVVAAESVASPAALAELAEVAAAEAVAAADAQLAQAEQGRLDAEAKGDAQSAAQWRHLAAEAAAWKEEAEGKAVSAAAIAELVHIVRFQIDPLVSVVLKSWSRLEALRRRNPSQEDVAKELEHVMHRLAKVVLWMPITHQERVEWISNPARRLFKSRSIATPMSPLRFLSALERLLSVDSSQCHPPAVALRRCMTTMHSACRRLEDPAPHSDPTLEALETAQMAMVEMALSFHVKRDVRWIAPTAEASQPPSRPTPAESATPVAPAVPSTALPPHSDATADAIERSDAYWDRALAENERDQLDAEARGDADAEAQCKRRKATIATVKKLTRIVVSETDPLVRAVLESWAQIDDLRSKHNPSREDVAKELDQVMRRLADVALWMPLSREARVEWISKPTSLPFTTSAKTAESMYAARISSRLERIVAAARYDSAMARLMTVVVDPAPATLLRLACSAACGDSKKRETASSRILLRIRQRT